MLLDTLRTVISFIFAIVDLLAVLTIVALAGIHHAHKQDKVVKESKWDVDDQSEMLGGGDHLL